ncbi:unnamed protein product [Schistosoma turkestanicum]|nr:unnamed protein product [Schistosoma turkestanicum]
MQRVTLVYLKLICSPENIEKVKRRCKAYRPRKLCEFRHGKKLLVLDIDYTIFDHLTPAESVHQLARPYLMEFLTRAYQYYDIAIWSATSITWILAKLSQLGMIPLNVARTFQHNHQQNSHHDHLLNNSNSTMDNLSSVNDLNATTTPTTITNDQYHHQSFRIALILDASDMISVNFAKHGIKEVKPLAVIWNNHPQWGPHNTIMFDDVRRNFIMNPQSGLRIRSYRDAHVNCSHDRELLRLIKYLELIAVNEIDFTKLNHHHWEQYIQKHRKQWDIMNAKRKKQLKLDQLNEQIVTSSSSTSSSSASLGCSSSSVSLSPSSASSSSSSSSSASSSISSAQVSICTTHDNVLSVPVITSSCTTTTTSSSSTTVNELEAFSSSSTVLTSTITTTTTSHSSSSSSSLPTSGQKRVHDKSSHEHNNDIVPDGDDDDDDDHDAVTINHMINEHLNDSQEVEIDKENDV